MRGESVRTPLLAATIAFAACGTAERNGTAERLWVLDGGECYTTDLSRWSPGVDEGKPWTFANHAYLIRHHDGLLLWDTGFADELAPRPDGLELADGAIRVRVTHPLLEQLAAIGVAPADVTHLALSHFHIDHAGNANAFAGATLYVQQLEHDAAFGAEPERFGYDLACYEQLCGATCVRLHGDHDLFGDGSVVILATPGHTPGHQSLLVRLPHAGALLLSGDVAHSRSNWAHRRTPATNFDRAMTLRSMARVDELLRAHGATLVIHHDAADAARLPRAPAFVD